MGRTTEVEPKPEEVGWFNEGSTLFRAAVRSPWPVASNCLEEITSTGAGLSARVRAWPRLPMTTTVSRGLSLVVSAARVRLL